MVPISVFLSHCSVIFVIMIIRLVHEKNGKYYGKKEIINFFKDHLMILIWSLTLYAELMKMPSEDFV